MILYNKVIYRGEISDVYWRSYEDNLYYYDINSSYTALMLGTMPVGSPKGIPRRDISINQLDNFFGFMVEVSFPEYNSLDYKTYLPL